MRAQPAPNALLEKDVVLLGLAVRAQPVLNVRQEKDVVLLEHVVCILCIIFMILLEHSKIKGFGSKDL